MIIPFVTSNDAFEQCALPLTLAEAPWRAQYPYMPEVHLRIAHNNQELLLAWHVREDCIRAEATADGGPVWEDSCVEFFLQPSSQSDRPSPYYNIECNCAGRLLVGYGENRHNREMAPADIMAAISRHSSLGSGIRPLTDGDCAWELSMAIPIATFFHDDLSSLSGRHARANFYKCGDRLTKPHFLTYFPIGLPRPDFHCPDFFGDIVFE